MIDDLNKPWEGKTSSLQCVLIYWCVSRLGLYFLWRHKWGCCSMDATKNKKSVRFVLSLHLTHLLWHDIEAWGSTFSLTVSLHVDAFRKWLVLLLNTACSCENLQWHGPPVNATSTNKAWHLCLLDYTLAMDGVRRVIMQVCTTLLPPITPCTLAHMKTNTEAWRAEYGGLRSGVINSPHKQGSVQSPAHHPSLHSDWTVWTSLSDLSALCRHHPGWQPLNWLQALSHWNSIYAEVSISS